MWICCNIVIVLVIPLIPNLYTLGFVAGRRLPLDIIQSVAKTNTLKLNTYTDTEKEKKPCSC